MEEADKNIAQALRQLYRPPAVGTSVFIGCGLQFGVMRFLKRRPHMMPGGLPARFLLGTLVNVTFLWNWMVRPNFRSFDGVRSRGVHACMRVRVRVSLRRQSWKGNGTTGRPNAGATTTTPAFAFSFPLFPERRFFLFLLSSVFGSVLPS